MTLKGSGGSKSDIRHLASSAKTLYELEGVIAIPALLEVHMCYFTFFCYSTLYPFHYKVKSL